jgi:hypothetical protein
MRPIYLKQRANCVQDFILYNKQQMENYLNDKAMRCEMYYINDPSIIHNEDLDPYCKIK